MVVVSDMVKLLRLGVSRLTLGLVEAEKKAKVERYLHRLKVAIM